MLDWWQLKDLRILAVVSTPRKTVSPPYPLKGGGKVVGGWFSGWTGPGPRAVHLADPAQISVRQRRAQRGTSSHRHSHSYGQWETLESTMKSTISKSLCRPRNIFLNEAKVNTTFPSFAFYQSTCECTPKQVYVESIFHGIKVKIRIISLWTLLYSQRWRQSQKAGH